MKALLIFSATLLIFATTSCSTDVREDAKRTPIGSVISGETKSAESYIQRVKRENKALDRDTWRPQSSERF